MPVDIINLLLPAILDHPKFTKKGVIGMRREGEARAQVPCSNILNPHVSFLSYLGKAVIRLESSVEP